jgi:phospholipid/cholesterol/gamma-HCH transport system substrate-binding protein
MTKLLIKSITFIVVTVLATVALAATIRNDTGGSTRQFHAVFTDATSLNRGDDVRMSGVKVGTVTDVEVTEKRLARVTFTASRTAPLVDGTIAELRFRNLIGQRYISLEPPTGSAPALRPGYTFDTDHTKPALDLTMLFNGFQPLLQLLSPEDVNNLSGQIVAVFQGEDATVDGLLSSTASLTSTLAAKDEVIGKLITSLSSVLQVVNDRSSQLDTTIVTLQQLVSGLADDRKTIGSTLDGLGDLTTSVADLLDDGREPLQGSITALDQLAGNLSKAEPQLDSFFEQLPIKLDRIGRTASYGSWINFYACSIEGKIPRPEGYYGDLGVKPIAERCR